MTKPLLILILLLPCTLYAQIVKERIDYAHNSQALSGYLYYDNQIKKPKPLVLVVHEWWGLNEYAKSRAKQLAQLGYVGFAVDMYGKNKQTEHGKQAKIWSKAITKNKENWQQRAITALNVAKKHHQVDADKTAAIGYCFGGATVMQMAYAGTNLDAVVSFHGTLIPPSAQQVQNIKASMLINNGAADKFISNSSIEKWQSAMKNTKADWVFVNYANAKHGFTNPQADEYGKTNNIDNLAYDKVADRRSWQLMQNFLQVAFQ